MWGCILGLVNRLLSFPPTGEHDDALGALKGAGTEVYISH